MTIIEEGTPVTSPGEPVSVTDIEAQVLNDLSDQVDKVGMFITALREECESRTRRALIVKQLVTTLNVFPAGRTPIEIINPPLRSIDSIVYTDTDGDEITLDSSLYRVVVNADDPVQPSKIIPVYGEVWPVALVDLAVIAITFTCGYGFNDAVTLECPKGIQQWITLNVANLVEHRESVVIGDRGETLLDMTKTLADGLIANFRVTKY